MHFEKRQLQKLDRYRWLVPRGTKSGMLTDALIYADEHLLEDLLKDLSLEQAVNVAMLPGIVGRSLAMPDIHQGYGFPIGGVAATDPEEGGVVSPGGVGFDINCGVRLLASTLTADDVRPKIRELVNQLFRDIPSGAGRKGSVQLSYKDLERVMVEGAGWMVRNGYGEPGDLEHCEESGAIEGADPSAVGDKPRKRGLAQVGTLGSGNHFLEVQYVERVFEPEIAQRFGLYENEVVVLIHSGSRGFGHQVCTDYLRDMDAAMRRYKLNLPDRQLACVPANSPRRPGVSGSDARLGQLCLGQPPGHHPLHPRSLQAHLRAEGTSARGLRRLPQHRQAGMASGERQGPPRAGAPQGRDARVSRRPAGNSRGL